jgi:hypothetical protein
MRRVVTGLNTLIGPMEELLAVFEGIEQAGVPNLVWLKRDLKTEPPVGRNSLARGMHH